jgi:hypothetical protein
MMTLLIGSVIFVTGVGFGGLLQQEEVLKIKTIKKVGVKNGK